MQHWDVIFWIGVLLIVLGIVFLPFKPPENVKIGVKLFGAEFEINTPAIALTLLGAALALAASLLPPPPPAQIAPPAHVASKPPDTSKLPGQGGPREEGEDEKRLENAGYDADMLKPLAASTIPAVREEVNRRLAQIAKDDENLKSAAYDKKKLLELEHDAQSPKVRDEALYRLKVIDEEEESLKRAGDDKEELTRLAHDAHSPEVQAEARHRLDIAAKESSDAGKKNAVQEEAHKQPPQFETPTPKSVSSIVGWMLFAVIDKNNNIKKQYLNIDGKPDQKFPAPNDTVIATKERAIFAIPYHWDITSGTIVHPGEKLTELKEEQKAKVGGDVFVASDPNGDRYAIAPISNLIGTDYTGAKSNFTPVASAPKILGYVFIGKFDDGANKFKFLNTTQRRDISRCKRYYGCNDGCLASCRA